MTKETPMEETKCKCMIDNLGGYPSVRLDESCPTHGSNKLPNKEDTELSTGYTEAGMLEKMKKQLFSPSDKTWDLCCRKEILRLWLRSGSMDIVRYTGECPECKHFIGLTQTSLEEATKFMEDTLTSATIKAKEDYKERILDEIDYMFDGYMGVETIKIKDLEKIMIDILEEPSK